MHDDVTDDSDATLDRRSLIKKIGVAGAVAWTAPVVMDSVLSPAAAQSSPGGPGPGPSYLFAEDFDGVPNGTGGLHYATFEPGGLTGTSSFVVTGSNVDGVEVPFFSSSPFTSTASTITVIELAGTGGGGLGGIAVTLPLPALTFTLSFKYLARTARAFTVGISGVGTTTVTPGSTNTLLTYSQVFTTSGSTTITIADTATSDQGVFIGDFSVTG